MGKVIQDLWILTNNGIVMYNRVFDPKINEQIFGAVLSSLNILAEKIADGNISHFEFSSIKFEILKENEILFVAKHSSKVKDKKIQDTLKIISRKFFDKYSDMLKNWNSDVNIFSDFKVEIEDALEDPMQRFWDDF